MGETKLGEVRVPAAQRTPRASTPHPSKNSCLDPGFTKIARSQSRSPTCVHHARTQRKFYLVIVPYDSPFTKAIHPPQHVMDNTVSLELCSNCAHLFYAPDYGKECGNSTRMGWYIGWQLTDLVSDACRLCMFHVQHPGE